MDRRKFLRNGSLTGIGLSTLGSWSSYAAGAESGTDSEKVSSLNLEEITVSDLQKKMQSGEESSVSITKAYLERIKEIDKGGPMLNSIIELNPDTLNIAERLDLERKNGKVRGPLHGIPILVKDNIDTGDQMLTTAGSLALMGNYAKEDAFVMKQLRDAGVVLLGKTNLSEWANFRSTHSCSGWSSREDKRSHLIYLIEILPDPVRVPDPPVPLI